MFAGSLARVSLTLQRTAGEQRLQPFFLLVTKTRGWYRFTLNRLVSLA